MNITFIGLGIMGSRMAENLLKNNIEVCVYNRSKSPIEKLVKSGAKAANSYKNAVENADIVFTMLSNPEVVEEVVTSEKGFIKHMKKDSLWVDCSTVDPGFSVKCSKKAEDFSINFMDAPVSGSLPQAQNAELIFLVGGSENNLDKISGLLEFMGKKTIHVGEIGKGSAFKIIVNSNMAQAILTFAESIHFGEKMGLRREFLLDTLPDLIISAPITKPKSVKIKKADFEEQFPLELMHKDLQLASKAAYENNHTLYLSNLAKELYGDAKRAGLGRKDMVAVFDYLDKKFNG